MYMQKCRYKSPLPSRWDLLRTAHQVASDSKRIFKGRSREDEDDDGRLLQQGVGQKMICDCLFIF